MRIYASVSPIKYCSQKFIEGLSVDSRSVTVKYSECPTTMFFQKSWLIVIVFDILKVATI